MDHHCHYINNCIGINNINYYFRTFLIYAFTNFLFFITFATEMLFGKKSIGYEGPQTILEILFFPLFLFSSAVGVYNPFINLFWTTHDVILLSLTAIMTVYPLFAIDSVY